MAHSPDPMFADCEKTQAPPDNRERDFLNEIREKQRAQYAQTGQPSGSAGYSCRPLSNAEILAELFEYHPPTAETLPKFQAINQAAKNFAEVVLQNCPAGADRSIALNCIRNARMFANAAIALNGLSL